MVRSPKSRQKKKRNTVRQRRKYGFTLVDRAYFLKYEQSIIFRGKISIAHQKRYYSALKLKPRGLCAGKEFFCSFAFIISLFCTRVGFTLSDMTTYFVFNEYLYYYMRIFCNLTGLEQYYFSKIWHTYMWKLQSLCG